MAEHFSGSSDRFVGVTVTFALDGTVRHVMGTWHAIDPAASRMKASGGVQDVVNEGLAQFDAERYKRNIVVAAGVPVRVWTVLKPRQLGPTRFAADISGVMMLPVVGPNKSVRYSEIEFAVK